MEKYYIVGFINDEVAEGILSKVMNFIRDEFDRTSKMVLNKQFINPKESLAEIYFENFTTNPSMDDNYSEILYLNEVAYGLLKNSGIITSSIGETEQIPKDAGVLIRMSTWSEGKL